MLGVERSRVAEEAYVKQDHDSLTAVAPEDARVAFPERCVACLDTHVTLRPLTTAHELTFFLGGTTLAVTLEQEIRDVPYCMGHSAQLDARGEASDGTATYFPGAHGRGTGTLGFAVVVDARLEGEGNDRTVIVTSTTYGFENDEYAALFRSRNGFGTVAEASTDDEPRAEGARDAAS